MSGPTLNLEELLKAVAAVNAWLDGDMSPEYAAQPLAHTWARITKVCEEAGEVWRALSKWTGENPRKGVCGTSEDVLGELGDTAAGAIFAIQHITGDTAATWAVFSAAVAKAHSRAVAAGVRGGTQ
jgi:hypothetical protein